MTHEQAIEICDRIATSDMGAQRICKEMHVSSRALWEWIEASEDNRKRYTRAREEQAELLADQIIAIADDGSKDTKTITTKSGEKVEVEDTEWTNRSKLRVESRKWVAAKLKPKKYGDKVEVDATHTVNDFKIEILNTGVTLAGNEAEVKE